MASFDIEEYKSNIIPVVVFFAISDILGFCGNIVVLFVYGTRYPKNRLRLLVLALSIVDFTSCCTTVPLETVSTYLYFDPPTRELCKAKNFFVQLTGLFAMFLLFETAVYKHRKICLPFKKQPSKRVLIILCCSGIVSSLGCAIPAGMFWDINNHNVTFNNQTENVRICEVHRRYYDTITPQIYRHVLSAYDIFLLATIVLYVLVAITTFRHFKKMKRRLHQPKDISKNSNGRLCTDNSATGNMDSSETNITINKMDSSSELSKTNLTFEGNKLDSLLENNKPGTVPSKIKGSHQDVRNVPPVLSGGFKADKTHSKSQKSLKHLDIRKVLMLVIIAGTFAVTFFMALTFGYVFAIRGLQDYETVKDYIVLFVCYRFYFIKYCLNPIVYFAFDRKFREEVINILKYKDFGSS